MLCGLAAAVGALGAQQPPVLHLDRQIALPGVEGRIDHLAADVAGQRVFLAALGNDTVEVIDLRMGRRTARIEGLHEPQGVLYVPADRALYVANGGDGVVRSYDGRTLEPLKSVSLGEDADNLRFDPARSQVMAGYGTGAIALLGLDLSHRADLRLPVHPESFQLSADGKQLFVNLPHNASIARIDMETRAVDAQWANPGAGANFPMALDAGRLFVACREPGELVALDAATGSVLQHIPTVGDADDLFYDHVRNLLYAIGGEGYVDVVRVGSGSKLTSIAHVDSAPGARTGLFVPEWNLLLVAAPARGTNPARLLVYSVAAP